MKRLAASFLLLAAPAFADPAPKLDMVAFFTGHTHGDNIIKIALHGPHKLTVDSIGGRNKAHQFVLIDTVQEEGKPTRKRVWAMRADGANHFTGSLTDAKGPVDIALDGSTATISYTMRDGDLKIVEQLQLRADGTLSNHVVAKKFGMKFAEVDGIIRKLD